MRRLTTRMDGLPELLREPLLWLAVLWLAAYQLAYFALWLPYRRRADWVEGTVTVTDAVPVSRTKQGTESPGQALYQLRGTLNTPLGPVGPRSVEQVVLRDLGVL